VCDDRRVRVYFPATLPLAREALRRGEVGPVPLVGYAVTPALREWYATGDLEELEYAAMSEAATASLRLLADDPTAPRRRVVLAADVPDGEVHQRPGERAAVSLAAPVPLSTVVSAHVDDAAAEPAVGAAAEAVPAADLGDDDARFTVDEAAGHELLWYAVQELSALLDEG
jgi:hypothetical protein